MDTTARAAFFVIFFHSYLVLASSTIPVVGELGEASVRWGKRPAL